MRPRVFIGSSSEGLKIAEALFSCLNRDTQPTLWTHQLFLPGQYPLEVLEKQLKRHSFAVLVASPDDELVKRGMSSPAMRDNLLLEFGLFTGALGRRRVFFVCPDSPSIELPSDLFGIVMATYDAERIAGGADDRAAAVESPCQQIREVIGEEWATMQQRETDLAERLLQSEKSQAVQRLYTVATHLRDALMAVQHDAFAAFSNRQAFEGVKRQAAEETRRIAESFAEDACAVGVEDELEELRNATTDALVDLPFPQELSLGREAGRQKAMNIGIGALDTFLRGGDPMRHVQDAASQEADGRLDSLGQRYSEWWAKHASRLPQATGSMQDALFRVLIEVSKAQMESH
jgi:hypothetical protein